MLSKDVYDLLIVGAGPCGLAAAISMRSLYSADAAQAQQQAEQQNQGAAHGGESGLFHGIYRHRRLRTAKC